MIVWFDGSCPLCAREIAMFRKLDRRGAIDFLDVSAPISVCPIDRRELMRRFHAQEPGEPVVSGAAAFVVMWRATPLLRPFGEAARWPPLLWVLERVYTAFLVVRPGFQAAARALVRRRA